MRIPPTLIAAILWVFVPAAAEAQSQPYSPSDVIVATGQLSEGGKAGNLWTLKADPAVKFRDEQIVQLSFMTPVAEPTAIYASYLGKTVELTGEVKSTSHGRAELGEVWRIGVPESGLSQNLLAQKVIAASSGVPSEVPQHAIARRTYHYAYFLFLADPPHGCEACYVPLLITSKPLEEIAKANQIDAGLSITTYERDSIWSWNGAEIISPGAIQLSSRTIRVNNRSYRYQAATSSEVLSLLEHPMGTIPISRPGIMNVFAEGTNPERLIADFRTIFRARERQAEPNSTSGRSEEGSSSRLINRAVLSELSVLDDGRVSYTASRAESGCSIVASWDCPVDETNISSSQYMLSASQFDALRQLLDSAPIKSAQPFYNAAPISDNFDIEIWRPGGLQDLPITAWMPSHVELREHPALLYLVCKSKELAHLASGGGEVAAYCGALPALR